MFIDPDKAQERLDSEDNLANRFGKKEEVKILEIPLRQPGKDRPNLSIEERTEIATRAMLGENQTKLAQEFGTTQENVSQIKNRKGHSHSGIDEDQVEKSLGNVRDKALDRLMSSLGLLTDDKLSGCSAKDLSVIAANMGRVVDKTLPKSESSDRVNFIVFAPELKQEKSFNVIEI